MACPVALWLGATAQPLDAGGSGSPESMSLGTEGFTPWPDWPLMVRNVRYTRSVCANTSSAVTSSTRREFLRRRSRVGVHAAVDAPRPALPRAVGSWATEHPLS